MQATVEYQLTEQAQRAQMAATGQPVARKQSKTIEVSAEDLPLCRIAEDGTASVVIDQHRNALLVAGWWDGRYATTYDPDILADIRRGQALMDAAWNEALPIISQYVLDTPELKMQDTGSHRTITVPFSVLPESPALTSHPKIDRKWNDTYDVRCTTEITPEAQAVLRERWLAEEARRRAEKETAIQAFLSDPARRLSISYNGAEIHLGGVTIYHYFEAYDKLYAEAMRRNRADDEARAAVTAAKAQAKADYIDAWIAEHGNSLIQEQHAAGLLPRKSALAMIAAATFAPTNLPAECAEPTLCKDDDCECCDNVVEGIPPEAYAWWKSFGPVPTGTTVEFHEVRECLESGEEAGPAEFQAVVTVPSGPFQFTRRIKLA